MVRLALPIVAVQLGQMLMVWRTPSWWARLGRGDRAVALGNLYFFAAAIFGMGALMALDPVVAQRWARAMDVAVARGVQRGLILSLGLSLVATACCFRLGPCSLLHQPQHVADVAGATRASRSPGSSPSIFRRPASKPPGDEARRADRRAIVAGNLANVGLNYLGFTGTWVPCAGAVGSAWARR